MKRLTKAFETQELTGNLDHLLIKTPESIVVTADVETAQEYHFEQQRVLVQIIDMVRTRANVVIVGPVGAEDFSVAVEFSDAVDPQELQDMIRAMGATVPFGAGTVDLSGVEVLSVDYKLFDTTQAYEATAP